MTRKQKRKLELKHHIHRCEKCDRELTNKASIARGMGKVCYKRHETHLRGLRELAAYNNA